MMRSFALIVFMLLAAGCASAKAFDPTPLIQAHSHNDYTHPRPLAEALECGFGSVEADVVLVDGQLLIAHKREEVTPGRTLESLYLEPLRKRIATHGARVYRNGPPLTLLVDFKSDADPTYAALKRRLRKYRDLLDNGALRIVLTGNRPPPAALANESAPHIHIDGVLAESDGDWSLDLMPQINVQWTKQFQWRGPGAMTSLERTKLRELVKHVHAKGRQIRFWEAPDQPRAWRELLDAGVDLINTDDVRGLRNFLLDQPGLYSHSSSRLPSGSAK
jgi:glycerophosphoryl diester phosphodiesterase